MNLQTEFYFILGVVVYNEASGGSCRCQWRKSRVIGRYSEKRGITEEVEYECSKDSCDNTKVKVKEFKFEIRKINSIVTELENSGYAPVFRKTNGSAFPQQGIACGCDPTQGPK